MKYLLLCIPGRPNVAALLCVVRVTELVALLNFRQPGFDEGIAVNGDEYHYVALQKSGMPTKCLL